MSNPRSSCSTEGSMDERSLEAWQEQGTHDAMFNQDKESNRPLLPRWQTSRRHQANPGASRAPRLLRVHLGWLVAAALFVLLLLQSTTSTWKEYTRQSVSPKSLSDANVTATALVEATGVTIVSAFFLVSNGKKHTSDDYWEWIRNFLENVEQPIVFYTSPDLLDRFIEMRGDKPIIWKTDYADAADMPPIQALGGAEWAQAMEWSDPEQYKHVAGVYSPWTAKPWMVQQVKDSNPYNSEHFFWADAGGFREAKVKHHFKGLPAQLERLYNGLTDDTVVLADALLVWPEGQAGVEYAEEATEKGWMDRGDCHIQGGWFGGKSQGIDWWYEETLRITMLQSMLHRFAGKEQDTWTHVARLNYERVAIQNNFLNKGVNTTCGEDPWFAYEYWADGPECEIPLWDGAAEHALYEQAKLSRTAEIDASFSLEGEGSA